MRGPAKEALRQTTKQEVAADVLGLTQSRVSHKLADGDLKLRELEALGPTFAANYGRLLVEQYGPLSNPDAHARHLIQSIRASLDELNSYIDHKRTL